VRKVFLKNLLRVICLDTNLDEEQTYINHDKHIGKKRYDFMVQESPSERAINIIGFLFSHMAYWNNHDVFYFVLKMIHWQGYHGLVNKNIFTSNN